MNPNVNAAVESALLDAAIDEIKALGKSGGIQAGELLETLGDQSLMTYTGVGRPDSEDSYVEIYSTKDGMPSTVLVNMLSKCLRKRWPESTDVPRNLWGKRVFSLKPMYAYVSTPNPLKCFLHPESSYRSQVETVGLGRMTCSKKNLATPYDQLMHAKGYHTSAWSVIQKDIDDRQVADGLAQARAQTNLQTQQLAVMQAMIESLTGKSAADDALTPEEVAAMTAEAPND